MNRPALPAAWRSSRPLRWSVAAGYVSSGSYVSFCRRGGCTRCGRVSPVWDLGRSGSLAFVAEAADAHEEDFRDRPAWARPTLPRS